MQWKPWTTRGSRDVGRPQGARTVQRRTARGKRARRVSADPARILAAYRQIAAQVRARGMKLIVKSKAIFSKGGWTSWDVASYYRRLTLDEYIRGRTEVALTIARELSPAPSPPRRWTSSISTSTP